MKGNEIKLENLEPTESSSSLQWSSGAFHTDASQRPGFTPTLPSDPLWGDLSCWRDQDVCGVRSSLAVLFPTRLTFTSGFTPTLPSDPLWGDLSCLTAFCWKHQDEWHPVVSCRPLPYQL
ncbi:hypothetical protein KOW79_009504 [Hemibagrus wyckioides]|uniref:Uncharacterized protein n=1 Tax=Hemibagrus wyckioides TaxID=337641 RepID=A0A9D3SNR7_9TELE|nr:hypothetical protein KOW79_009504 [Hemibagrus wyckioides]